MYSVSTVLFPNFCSESVYKARTPTRPMRPATAAPVTWAAPALEELVAATVFVERVTAAVEDPELTTVPEERTEESRELMLDATLDKAPELVWDAEPDEEMPEAAAAAAWVMKYDWTAVGRPVNLRSKSVC